MLRMPVKRELSYSASVTNPPIKLQKTHMFAPDKHSECHVSNMAEWCIWIQSLPVNIPVVGDKPSSHFDWLKYTPIPAAIPALCKLGK